MARQQQQRIGKTGKFWTTQIWGFKNLSVISYFLPCPSAIWTAINRTKRISLKQRHLRPQNQTSYLCLSLGVNRDFDDSFPLA